MIAFIVFAVCMGIVLLLLIAAIVIKWLPAREVIRLTEQEADIRREREREIDREQREEQP